MLRWPYAGRSRTGMPGSNGKFWSEGVPEAQPLRLVTHELDPTAAKKLLAQLPVKVANQAGMAMLTGYSRHGASKPGLCRVK